MEKNCTIAYGEDEALLRFASALASPLRIAILRELSANSMSVKELAFKLNIPLSTASANIKVLEESGLLRTNFQAGKHGSMKLCSLCYEKYFVEFAKAVEDDRLNHYVVDMPIGSYFDLDIVPTCGMADEFSYIGKDDDIRTFYSAKRFQAQLIWLRAGFLEYRFPLEIDRDAIRAIHFSLECCSEAPGYRNEFPSDITFWINGFEVWRTRKILPRMVANQLDAVRYHEKAVRYRTRLLSRRCVRQSGGAGTIEDRKGGLRLLSDRGKAHGEKCRRDQYLRQKVRQLRAEHHDGRRLRRAQKRIGTHREETRK